MKKEITKRIKCHWCGKFLSKDNCRATIKEPDIFYCHSCYKKGEEMENQAMGLYDNNYSL